MPLRPLVALQREVGMPSPKRRHSLTFLSVRFKVLALPGTAK